MSEDDRWLDAMQRYIEGQVAPGDVAALEAAMLRSAALRRKFLELANLDSAVDRLLVVDVQTDDLLAGHIASLQAGAPLQAEANPAIGEVARVRPPEEDAQPPSSSLRHFFASFVRHGWPRAFGHPITLGLSLLLLIGLVAGIWCILPSFNKPALGPGAVQAPKSESRAAEHPAMASPESGPVAQLTRIAAVRWSGKPLRPGQRLSAGQSLALDAGVLELTFDLGARVVIQAPAVVKLESAAGLRLEKGKLSAEITDVRARGFRVNTPQESIIDQGTEFGVEVTPQGSSRVHVFKGAVDIASRDSRQSAESRRLLENSGARVEEGSRAMTLLQDTGESFIRRVEDAGRDRHVVAYWRFEDRPVGAILPDTAHNSQQVCASVDSSFNGNDLYTYMPESRPTFSDRVPAAAVPQTGGLNRSCLDTYSMPSYKGYGRDVYTHSEFSHAAPIDIQKITPRQWTVEASVWPHGVKGEGFPQTFVGRDATYAPRTLETPPRLALQINARRRFAIRFADVRGRFHEATAENLPVEFDRWYHVAAASDGRQLRLYVDSLDGRGYQLRASAALPDDGGTALGKGEDVGEWTVGRGHVGKLPGEWFHGLIDEVRISDVARKPEEFLFSRAAAAGQLPVAVGGRRSAK